MNAIDVTCPQCSAAIGAPCTKPKRDGREVLQDFHEARLSLRDVYEMDACNRPHITVPDGEPYFVLRAQDVNAASLVQMWIALNQSTAPADKIKSAEAVLEAMRKWPHKKRAD